MGAPERIEERIADPLAQARRGHSALIDAYLSKRANLLRFLAARCGSRSQAEDLAQDLFLKVASVDPALPVENAVAMLYRMAANLATDHLRRRHRLMARDHAWRETETSGGDEPVAEQVPAEEALAARQRLTALLRAIDELPPRRREVFRLHKLEGRTCAETARLMGISVKAVEKQITAALKALAWPQEQ